MRVSISLLLLALFARPVWAQRGRPVSAPPEAPWFGSGEGRVVYDVAAAATQVGCPLDDKDGTKRALIQKAAAAAAAAKDPKVRAAFTDHATALQAWFDAYLAGVPNVATWAEINKLYQDADAAVKALPANGGVMAAPEAYLKLFALAPTIEKYWTAVDSASPCPSHPGKWGEIAAQAQRVGSSIESNLGSAVRNDQLRIDNWAAQKPAVDAAPPATYWEHVDWVKRQIDFVNGAKKVAPEVAELTKWAAYYPPAKVALDAARVALDGAHANDQAIATALATIAMPAMKKNAGHAKLLVKAVAEQVADGGKLMSESFEPGLGATNKKWTEEVEVRRDTEKIWYKTVNFESEFFTTYYAWKPSPKAASAPDLPGLPASEICEIWRQNFTRYLKGDPSKKDWFASENALEGYLPCANAGKTSALKVK